jgi:hypothetical protein
LFGFRIHAAVVCAVMADAVKDVAAAVRVGRFEAAVAEWLAAVRVDRRRGEQIAG